MLAGLGQAARQQTIAAHGEDDTGQAEQQHHNHGGQAQHDAEADDLGGPVGAHQFEGGGQRGAVLLGEIGIGDHAGGHHGHEHVHDNDEQHAHADAERHVLVRVLGLLRGGGHHVESDEREEHERRAREDARNAVHGWGHAGGELPQRLGHHAGDGGGAFHGGGRLARRNERGEVGGLDVEEADDHHKEHDGDLEHGHSTVHAGADLGAEYEQRGKERHDDDRGDIDMEGAERQVGVGVPAHQAHEIVEVYAPIFGNHGAGHQHFQNQIPADDPGHDLADRGVGEGVGGAGHRNHRSEFGVAHHGCAAHDAGNQEADDHGRAGVEGGGLRTHREDAGAHGYGHAHD